MKGFESDVTALSRIRTALKLDARLDRTKVALAVRTIDTLVDQLCDLTTDIERARESA